MLPESQFETGWVLAQCGRAYLEMAQYRKVCPRVCHPATRAALAASSQRACVQARSMFERMRSVAPDRLQGLDYYSTALWHLREEVPSKHRALRVTVCAARAAAVCVCVPRGVCTQAALSFLAQEAVELDKRAPQTWIVVGNCFSLQKDHESALQFLKRVRSVVVALRLTPRLRDNRCRASRSPGDSSRSTVHVRVHAVRPRAGREQRPGAGGVVLSANDSVRRPPLQRVVREPCGCAGAR